MLDILAAAGMAIIMGIFGWLAFTSIVKIYRAREGKPIVRFAAIVSGLFLGSIWTAVPIFLLIYDPIGTIFGAALIAGALIWMLNSEKR